MWCGVNSSNSVSLIFLWDLYSLSPSFAVPGYKDPVFWKQFTLFNISWLWQSTLKWIQNHDTTEQSISIKLWVDMMRYRPLVTETAYWRVAINHFKNSVTTQASATVVLKTPQNPFVQFIYTIWTFILTPLIFIKLKLKSTL